MVVACASGAVGLGWAQAAESAGGAGSASFGPQERSAQEAQSTRSAGREAAFGPQERGASEWLVRLQRASRVPSYVGTFVVSSANGALSSARIWHVCEGDTQMERVDVLSGVPRTTFRRNDALATFLPQSRTVRMERREVGGVFPNLFAAGALDSAAEFYEARHTGESRVAGFDADIVQLSPRDDLRFGYRIWSEKRTGLVVKTQTLDQTGRVLEQAAFSELQLDAPVKVAALQRMMSNTDGFKVEKLERVASSPEAEGWRLKATVVGFKSQSSYRRAPATSILQWTFSDGLAMVSLFIEPFDARRHISEGDASMGATHMLARRIASKGGEWWVTAVGEVPVKTLRAFVDNLERLR